MPIDFHAAQNRLSYASREADLSWMTAVSRSADPAGKIVYDAGCGGGVYTRAWGALGAAQVIGVDFAAGAIEVARTQTGAPNITYRVAGAADTGMPASSTDILFA
jgi:predicted RNA methylase